VSAARTRLLSIHASKWAATRAAESHPQAWVELGTKGTTSDRPWGVVAPAVKKVPA
jgi:hypothetical protein